MRGGDLNDGEVGEGESLMESFHGGEGLSEVEDFIATAMRLMMVVGWKGRMLSET